MDIDVNKLYKIVVDEQAGVDSSEFVKVGVNGKMYQIMRGHEVVVPGTVVHVLQNAIYTKYKYDEKGNIIEYKVPRIPFRVIGEATPREKTALNKKSLKKDKN